MARLQESSPRDAEMPSTARVDMNLEVVVIPVADVDRAKAFYTGLGWRLDADISAGADFRAVQVTPPGSQCSVIFGNANPAAPGSAQGWLVVPDIDAARADLLARGVAVSEPFHREGAGQVPGPDPQRRSYNTFVSFRDPDGNVWLVQEVTKRLPGRVEAPEFGSAKELASALRRAEAAHGAYEARIGKRDADWPEWYADFILREQAGTELPS